MIKFFFYVLIALFLISYAIWMPVLDWLNSSPTVDAFFKSDFWMGIADWINERTAHWFAN